MEHGNPEPALGRQAALTGRYRVRVVRSIRRTEETATGRNTEEREQITFELGPYRSRLGARLVAWLNRFDSGGWVQRCTVEQITKGGT